MAHDDRLQTTASDGEPTADVVETPSMSVIIPAFNEADYIRETLDWLGVAEQHLEAVAHASVQILVVDNARLRTARPTLQRAPAPRSSVRQSTISPGCGMPGRRSPCTIF